MLNYDSYEDVLKAVKTLEERTTMASPTDTYKGYKIAYNLEPSNTGGYIANISITKNGRTLQIKRSIRNADGQSYKAITQFTENIVDFVEYQVGTTVAAVMKDRLDTVSTDVVKPLVDAVSDTLKTISQDEDEETNEENNSSDLSNWFKNTNTSRYLEDK